MIKIERVEVRCALSPDDIRRHMRSAMARGLPEFVASSQSASASIVAGGPSLADTVGRIAARPVIACNGAARFIADRGVAPDFCCVADGSDAIAAYFTDPVSGRYLCASQCPPAVFDALSGRDVTLWHNDNGEGVERAVLEERGGPWTMVGGGSTVGLRAVYLAYLMGARDIHLYGFDSCYQDGEHHAYQSPSPVDAAGVAMPVHAGGRTFSCAPWMISQADEFQRVVKALPDATFTVHGDGLISWVARLMSTTQQERQ